MNKRLSLIIGNLHQQ